MSVLVDTSVWIEHFRGGADELDGLLAENAVLSHPVVLGELACGGLKDRQRVLGNLKLLPRAPEASWDEAMALIETHRLHGRGLGFGDMVLLASALIGKVRLLSFDKALAKAAAELQIAQR